MSTNSLLGRPVSFRLPEETWHRYRVAAHRSGMGLSAYLRSRLEAEDGVADQLDQLRLALVEEERERLQGETLTPVVLETLLLLRRSVPPGELRAVHQEMRRLRVAPWTPTPRVPDDAGE